MSAPMWLYLSICEYMIPLKPRTNAFKTVNLFLFLTKQTTNQQFFFFHLKNMHSFNIIPIQGSLVNNFSRIKIKLV